MEIKNLSSTIIDLENQLRIMKYCQANPYQALIDNLSQICSLNGYLDYGFKLSKEFKNSEPVSILDREVSVWYKEKNGSICEQCFKDLDDCLYYIINESETIRKNREGIAALG